MIIGIGIVSTTFYHNYLLDSNIVPGKFVLGFNIIKNTYVDKKKIFDTMADIENYPNILPKNIISVKIINETQPGISTIIFAEEIFTERGIVINQIVKHDIFPYERHTITVMSGDAKGTKITATFNQTFAGTQITTDVKMHIQGILAYFGPLARTNIESAIGTTIDTFIEYAENQT